MTVDNIGIKPKGILSFLFPSTSAWVFWLFMGLLFKGLLFFIQVHDHSVACNYTIPGFIGGTWGDTGSYLEPVDSLLSGKGYSPDYRMPGYAAFLVPLFYFFSRATACNIIIFLQVLVSSVSVYALALGAKNIFKNNSLFYIVFYFYCVCGFSNCYDDLLLTESFSTSFLIFSVYFISKYFASLHTKNLFISGFFLTWLIFLRPVFIPLLLLFFLLILIYSKKIKTACYVLIAFILVDGIWMVRNYNKYKEALPLLKSLYFFGENSYYPYVLSFCGSWGGYRSPTQTWLLPEISGDSLNPHTPDYIYTSKFNFDSLKKVRELIKKVTIDSAGIPVKLQNEYTAEIKQKLVLYTQSIKQEKPEIYYVKANWASLHLIIYIDYYSVVFLNKYTIALSKWIYYFTLIAGGIGILLLLKPTFSNYNILLFVGIPLYTIVIHALVLRVGENRYLAPAYPYIVVCAGYAVYYLYTKLAGNKKQDVK